MHINDSFEFLRFVNSHNARTLMLSPGGTCSELTNSADELSGFIEELTAMGYLKRYIRSCTVTAVGVNALQ